MVPILTTHLCSNLQPSHCRWWTVFSRIEEPRNAMLCRPHQLGRSDLTRSAFVGGPMVRSGWLVRDPAAR